MSPTRRCWSSAIRTTSSSSSSLLRSLRRREPSDDYSSTRIFDGSEPMHVTTPATDVVALTDAALIPGLGFLPVSAYLLSAEQPVLVDTGMPDSRSDLLDALWNRIDPADLRWIYLTHPDRDHTGSLMEILDAAPAA